MLRLIDIDLVLGERKILHDVNLHIKEREVRSILGLNGTGKSTLASVVMGVSAHRREGAEISYSEHRQHGSAAVRGGRALRG